MEVRSISHDLTARVEGIVESLHEAEMRANDLRGHDTCLKFADIKTQLSTFLRHLDLFKLDFVSKLSDLLPRIRGAGAEEKELADLVSSVEKSPFYSEEMTKFLRSKDTETKVLAKLVQQMAKVPKIGFDFPNSTECNLDTLLLDDQVKHVVCFLFNSTTKSCPYLESLQRYVRTGGTEGSADDGSGKERSQATLPDVSRMRSKLHAFVEFARANSDSDSIALVAKDHLPGVTEVNTSGPTLVLYTEGVLVDSDFQPPGKPGIPQAGEVTENSIILSWSEPTGTGSDSSSSSGTSNFSSTGKPTISYVVLYRLSAADSDSEPRRVTSDTTSVCVTGLSPGTEYIFRLQVMLMEGVVSAESDALAVCTRGVARLADVFLKHSKLLRPGKPAVYQLPSRLVHGTPPDDDPPETPLKYEVGWWEEEGGKQAEPMKPEIVLWLIGPVGVGKTTLINSIANFLLGVEWKDDFRFQATVGEVDGEDGMEEEGTDSPSWKADVRRTKVVTAYAFTHTHLPYTLTMVDTQGVSDNYDFDIDVPCWDKQLESFLSGEGGMDYLHGICFVSPAPFLPQVTSGLLDAFGETYGRARLFMLATFADANDSRLLASAGELKIPFFKFNNSALYLDNGEQQEVGAKFWEVGRAFLDSFFRQFPVTSSGGIALTKELFSKFDNL